MTVLKLIAIYSALFAIVFFAQSSEYAGLLHFMAALTGMSLLSFHAKSDEEPETVAVS